MSTAAERRSLRARAHALDPVVMVSDQGLTEGVLAEAERALAARELIKVRVAGADRGERQEMLKTLCERTGAIPVQHIGKMLVIYRPRPERPAVSQPCVPRSAKGRRAQPARGGRV